MDQMFYQLFKTFMIIIKVFFIYVILKIGDNMNNDLENLYGNNDNTMNTNSVNQSQPQETYNNISSEPQDLSSMYGNNNVMQTTNQTASDNSSDISLNQEGLDKLYNQKSYDLEAEPEPAKEKTAPVIKTEVEPPKGIVNEYVTDEDLLVAYVGKNFNKLASKPFNFAAFFFGSIYLCYRKKFTYALILLVITTVLCRFLTPLLVTIGSAIIVGILFNRLYINDAKKYVEDLKKRNSTKTNSELKEICKKNGGTSILFIFVGMILSSIISGATGAVLTTLGFPETNNSININPEDFINNKNVYLGTVEKDENIDITEKYTIEVPSEFKKEDDASSQYSYEQDKCHFELYKADNITNAKQLAKEMSIYYLSVEDIKNRNINNINWYYIENEDGTEKQYHYVTSKNNEVYVFEYFIESNDKQCINAKDNVLQSIKSK